MAVTGQVRMFVPLLLRGQVVSLSYSAYSFVVIPITKPMLINRSAITFSFISFGLSVLFKKPNPFPLSKTVSKMIS